MAECSLDELMTVAAARTLGDGQICFVGIGLPSKAANLARATHAPRAVLIYESGAIGAKPQVLPLSIGDGELAETADTVVPTHEIFRYWLQGGRIDLGFLGAAQIDRFANLNTTVIGPYQRPKVRLPGAGGAPEIAAHSKAVVIVMKHSRQGMVAKLDFVTTAGFLSGGDARRSAGLNTQGPIAVITDKGILKPDPDSKELELVHLHPGVELQAVIDATGWSLRISPELSPTPMPSPMELDVLRALEARTAGAHGVPVGQTRGGQTL
ncbi:MAG: CoA-transferase subunit beta [Candidatus Sericytochromatia bacterium]